ncbi:MAG: Ig-like domain-containing protein [Muribaculaceae bacterium]|nr:Ig-like domain-containing protein [Muribaculaceae bacterium]
MKKFLLATALGLITASAMNALPVNLALSFTPEGYVNCGAMPQLNNLNSYSIQFWINPTDWTEGAVILKRGDNFKIALGANNSVVFTNGANKVTATGFKPGEWNQVTLMVDNGEAKILVNSASGGSGTLGTLDETKRGFIMGSGYNGLLDEVRVWNEALSKNEWMPRFDYFTNNTINKFNPMWDNLVAYYKMDQGGSLLVVEYKCMETSPANDNHGVITGDVKKVVAENDKMPYLVSAAYTENARFYDRLIPQDAYLLSNEIIILGADCVAEDGSVKLKTLNNHAIIHGGVSHESTKGTRNGVAYLDGKAGTYIESPSESIHKYKVDNLQATPYTNSDLSSFSFQTRIWLDEWQPGAILFCKENEKGDKGIRVYLGEKENTLVARINGNENTSEVLTGFKTGQWSHIAFVVDGSQRQKKNKVKFYGWAKEVAGDANSAIDDTSLQNVTAYPIKIGEGLKGWLDETYLSNFGSNMGEGKIATNINVGVIVPSVQQGRTVSEMNAAGFLYNYDDSKNLGYSDYSQDNIRKQILKQYEGFTKPRIILSVRGHSDNTYEDAFRLIMNDAAKADKFGKDLATLGEDYDGVEFDLEWMENSNTAGTNNFQSLPTAVKKYLPAGKLFRVSIHNQYYKFAEPLINDEKVTGFTIQQYGPNTTPYPYNTFTSALQTLKKEGYPENKLMTSFSTTMTSGGVKDGALANWTYKDENTSTYNGATFMTPLQVYRRAKYTRENGFMGIFYWDMGNDYWLGDRSSDYTFRYDGMPEFNQTKWANFAISSNIDRQKSDGVFNHSDTEFAEGEELTLPIYLSSSSVTMHATESVQLIASLLGGTDALDATWTTSDATVATVEKGVVTALKPGNATITATYDNKSATCEVTVETTIASSVAIDPINLTLKVGENGTLIATVSPIYTTDKTITWSSDNTAVATVSDGKVTAVAVGIAKITATCGNISAVCIVNVEADKTEEQNPEGEENQGGNSGGENQGGESGNENQGGGSGNENQGGDSGNENQGGDSGNENQGGDSGGENQGGGSTEDPSLPEDDDPDDTGIEGIVNDAPVYVDVYSITGVLVKKHVNKEEINEILEKGIYIIDRKKVVIRK